MSISDGGLQVVEVRVAQSIGGPAAVCWPYPKRMKHCAQTSLGRQYIEPIIGALGMTVFFVQLLK